MECNRDEALRAKEISESKLSTKDITGAKKFALKAQTLYPGLEGTSQLLAVLDIYVAAENKVNGELDYYEILGVNPLADDETVRKSYRKLALSLHPDKNKSVGAEGAFQYVSEAWNFLSDKDKRSFYDHRRNNGRVFKQKVQRQNNVSKAKPPQPPKQNGFCNFTKVTTSQAKVTTTTETKVTTSQKPKATTTQKTKDNNTTTRKTKDTSNSQKDKVNAKTVPVSASSSSYDNNKQVAPKTFWTVCKRCKLQYEFVRIYLNRNLLCPTCHGPFVAIETPPPNINPSSSKAPEKTQGKEKNTSSKWAPFLKTNNPADVTQAATIVQQAYDRAKRDREEAQAATKREEALRRKISKKEAKKSSSKNLVKNKEIQVEVNEESMKKRLMKKATMEIKKKLHEWSSEVKVNNEEAVVSDVPVPNFHDFDYERSENCFEEGQVWAAYDHIDGMPRTYGLIQKVISVDPFKMKVCWLNSKVNNMMCFGEFIAGKHDLVTVPNYFSHKANFKKQESGKIRVFPRKGDVCALYMNDDKTKYEIVEVDDYDEENGGVIVTPLAKVFGFKAVFHRHIDLSEARVISESEMFRFSHQIPSCLLTGRESPNAPKGCIELDPAAVPVEFLRVSENVNEVEKIDDRMVENDCGLAEFKEKGDKMDVNC